jgi:HlyD family secretion protein
MDIPRPSTVKRSRKVKRILYVVAALIAVPLITFALSRMKPAAPGVDRATVWVDTVKRGPMLRQVRGTGTLVPEQVRFIAATTEGQVESVLMLPGTTVAPDTLLIVLSNPQLEQEAQDAGWQVKAAEAEYQRQRVQLESQHLDQEAIAARVQSEYHQAKLKADSDEDLVKKGLIAELPAKLSRVTADELANRYRIEKERLAMTSQTTKSQLAAQQARVEQLNALARLKQNQVANLRVRAGTSGVLQQLPVEPGQRVTPGTTLAKVAQPEHLKAELRIAETQAKDIQVGQKASIDTRNGVIPGHVVRIDPAVLQGTVTVDVTFDGPLSEGARPDLSVDGTVEIERLDDVLYVGRPVNGQSNSTVSLFRLEDEGAGAARAQVKLGRSSVSTIEIVDGLQVGDQVILSDTSAWDAYDRIQLN